MLTRRELLGLAPALLVPLVAATPAEASLARALTLPELVSATDRSVVALPQRAESRWEQVGGRRIIVTDTEISVELDALGSGPATLLVRTLGGRVGRHGMVVHGSPQLPLGAPCMLFLRAALGDHRSVVGSAQGHYPLALRKSGERALERSPELGELTATDAPAAVDRLAGQSLADAVGLVLDVAEGKRR